MRTVLALASLVAAAVAVALPATQTFDVEYKSVDADFVAHQKKVLYLVEKIGQLDQDAEWYKIGKEYDIEAHAADYTNKEAFEFFVKWYKTGEFMPKHFVFSVFYEKMREEAISLFKLFYYAKDFETFYKTAAFARYHFNEGQFLYAYYIAVFNRADTNKFVLPPPFEVYPYFFVNSNVYNKIYQIKMQNGVWDPKVAHEYGIEYENNNYIFYSNYSDYLSYSYGEDRLAYFTEDIEMNSYYYYNHANMPFWMKNPHSTPVKEYRGEYYYFFYQQLLARYYLERLSNGLGEIPEFTWYGPFKYGYSSFLFSWKYPFQQRNNYYYFNYGSNIEEIQFLDSYEKNFLQYLQRGHFKAYNQEIDLHNSKSANFVGNYWQSNADLYEKTGFRNYEPSYEIAARRVLSATPDHYGDYHFVPSPLAFYQTSLRDPAFYQLYKKILGYFVQSKEYLQPYEQNQLHFVGVKINDVQVSDLYTYYDYYDFDVTNGLYFSKEEYKTNTLSYKVRQPRLNHKHFTVSVDIKSDVDTEAVFKIFIGPKYDSKGYPIKLEDNWMNFVALDWFVHKLTPGQNKIERNCDDFFYYKDDSISTYQIFKMLEQGKVPTDMSEHRFNMPKRFMLPKGTPGGFPYQFFVVAYKHEPLAAEYEPFKSFMIDSSKPLGWPFDRPVSYESLFKQPNMFFEDVSVYFKGDYFTYKYNIPDYKPYTNEVPKH